MKTHKDEIYKFMFKNRKYGKVGRIYFCGESAPVHVSRGGSLFVGNKKIYDKIPDYGNYTRKKLDLFIRSIPVYIGMRNWLNIIGGVLK